MATSFHVALILTLTTLAIPAFAAKPDCTEGYKIFINRVTPFIDRIEDLDLATQMRRGLSVFEACQAGDNFSPHGIWDQIAADMAAKAKK